MSGDDDELRALLVEELEKHRAELRALSPPADRELLNVLHALRGTAAIGGQHTLSEAFARLERRHHGDRLRDTLDVLADACTNLRAGRPAIPDTWPVPPPDLARGELAAGTWATYAAEMHDRVAGLDDALAHAGPAFSALELAFRHVHAMKGAASSVGDEPVAWFCHGLETRLRAGMGDERKARDTLDEVAYWRAVILDLVEDPVSALTTLRRTTSAVASPQDLATPQAPSAPSNAPGPEAGDSSLRVPGAALDRVLERLRHLSLASRDVGAQLESARHAARQLRAARFELVEARRLIGPSRPWGAPAAALNGIEHAIDQLASTAVRLEHLASRARSRTDALQLATHQAHVELGTLRRTTMAHVFDKVRASAEAAAARLGTFVRIEVRGDTTAVDRRLAEALVDPILQLARNAVAHGIEPPEIRRAAGKPPWGRIRLAAEVRGAHLLVLVRDDGAGVNVQRLREQAKRWTDLDQPDSLDDDALVHLLFTPGLTTRDNADLLSGRGVGLDVALRAARRLGGSIRLRNWPGRGLTATLLVPLVERGLVRVLWVQSGGQRFALPARFVLRALSTSRPPPPAPSLLCYLDPLTPCTHERFVLQVGRPDVSSAVAFLSVAGVEGMDEAAVRPVPPLAAMSGPYVGVLVAPDGAPVLLVDVLPLVERGLGGDRSPSEPTARAEPGD